jgi:four helix bundle protein
MFGMCLVSAGPEAARLPPRPPHFSRRIMQRFTDLKVWQRSHALVLDLYRLTASFPAEERFGLTSQLRRSAASVPTNIAEGSKRQRPADYARYLNIAESSAAETEYLLILSRDLGYLPADAAEKRIAEAQEISRMLHGLRSKVEASP